VVLYALPELDGAIDAIPLGGLCCGDKVCQKNNNDNNCKNIDAIPLGGLCCGEKV